MIRRLNYTGRKKIPRSRVTVRLLRGADALYAFSAEFDLSAFAFPTDARVFVEAYNVSSYMRFPFGTVGQRQDPKDTRLVDVTSRPLPKFRLKVVDQRERNGLLLGVADKLVPLRPDEDLANKQSLLPVNFCDLGDRVWALELSDDWPELQLNKDIDGIAEVARSGESFLALVYPEVVRQILQHILIVEEHSDPYFDDNDWMSLWLRYVCSLPGMNDAPSGASEAARARRPEWIEDAVQAFCRTRQVRQRFETAIQRDTT